MEEDKDTSSVCQFDWRVAEFDHMEDSENIAVVSEKEDAKHTEPEEPKCGPSDSEPGGGANEDNKENQETREASANDSEACAQKGGVTENAITVEEKEKQEVTENLTGELDKETELNDDKESEVKDEGKENSNNPPENENNCCNKDGQLEEKQEEKRTKETEGKTEKKEDEKDTKQSSDEVKKKMENPGRKSAAASSSALRASTKSSSRSARPSARRDAMAKFQKEETPGVRNFRVQRTSVGIAGGASIKQRILTWCKSKTQKYEGVCIENFSSSWSDGLAFCALIHRFFPSAFDFSTLKASEREKNFTLAFSTAETLADCCPLLEVSDMLLMGKNPDPLCVFTYVQALCHHLSKIEKERREKESMEKDMSKDEDEGISEGNEKGDGEREESEQNEETEQNGSDSAMKTEQETDQNENVINADVVDGK